MNPQKPKDPTATDEAAQNKIEIEDLPLEEGSEHDADRLRGGGYVLQDVMVSGNRPRRP